MSLPSTDSSCASKAAQIEVQDGFLRRICGCKESSTDPVAESGFTCTISTGSTVLFLMQGHSLNHQIRSSGSNEFPPSGVVGPLNPKGPFTHSITFDKAGTYDFVDQFQSTITGQIIVN